MRQHLLHWWSYVTDSLSDRNWILAISHVCQFSNHPSRWNIFLVTLVSLVVSLNTLVTPVSFVIPVRVVSLVTICIICTLHNFQFYPAHLWTDFQSCCWMRYGRNKPNVHLWGKVQTLFSKSWVEVDGMVARSVWPFVSEICSVWPRIKLTNQHASHFLLNPQSKAFSFEHCPPLPPYCICICVSIN